MARATLHRRRVLIVDDDPLILDLVRAVLEDAGVELDIARDGMEALKRAGERVPDVVVLDVMMPGMDGFEVCRAFRSDPRYARSRIVMLTARATEDDRREGLAAGADAFFTKPFSALELIETVRDAS